MSEQHRRRAPRRVSIVIPCYNQARFLRESIASVRLQTYPDCEIIVVDDGSTDEPANVAAGFEDVACLRQANRGLAAARNAGLAAITGGYVVFLDADDRLLPAAIACGVACLDANPECAFAYGDVTLIDTNGTPARDADRSALPADPYLELLRRNYIWTCGAVIYRSSIFDHLAAFDRRVSPSADFELNARIASRFPICCSGDVVLEYRRHDDSMSHNAGVMLKAAVTARRLHRRLLRGRPQHLLALRTGTRAVQEHYGSRLADQVRRDLRAGQWLQSVGGAVTLLRYHPRGFLRHSAEAIKDRLP